MIRYILTMLLLCAECAALAKPAMIKPWSADESKACILHVSPLPKSIEITGRAVRSRGAIRVVPRSDLDMLGTRAVRELMESIDHYEDVRFVGPWSFTIAPQIGGPDAEPLRKLENSEQAYRIIPGENDKGLRLVALASEGLYYASKTLQQLIRVYSRGDEIVIPIVKITDWPDLDDRGLWGADCFLHCKQLSDLKMNRIEQISAPIVDSAGVPSARLKPGHETMIEECPRHGIKPTPVILHLEQVGGKGVFQAYPELRGIGGHENAICYSKPEFVEILAGWMADLGALPHVEEIDVWMAENLQQQGGCRCEECSKMDRTVLEARTIVSAWKKARERVPGLGLKVSTSEETENSNEKAFAELPEGVKVGYYHSLLTYTAAEFPMIRQYLADHARSGRWIGVTPSLVAYVHFTQPFTGADFVRTRMNEFADKNLSGLLGYIVPRLRYATFNLEAAAEWSWNARGRTTREFAESYAVRHGMKDPTGFAEWSQTIGHVEWDIYASHWPGGQQRTATGIVAEQLRQGTLPELGYVLWDAYCTPFGGIKTEEELNADVQAAATALGLAREMGQEEYIQESLVAQGYIEALKALWELRGIVKPDGKLADQNAALCCFRMYAGGLNQAAEALPKWEACINEGENHTDERFTDKSVAFIRDMIEQMKSVAKDCGIEL